MPKMNVNRSIQIETSVEKVFENISNFNHWKVWSPWLITDPEATVDVATDGKSYSWKGKRVGEGSMKVTNEKENQWVEYDLEFLKPWKSQAKVKFDLSEGENGVNTKWSMDSKLPFFLFWMKKQMEAYIGMDYERGLSMLKEYAESGRVESELKFKGEVSFTGCKYIGIKTNCEIKNVGNHMEQDYTALFEKYANQASDKPFSIYHKWDLVNGKMSYTASMPVNEVPTDLPSNFISGQMPSMKVQKVQHIGPYKNIGNAWSALYGMKQNKEIKTIRGQHPFELYHNTPTETPENELITDICFPVK